MPSSFFEKGFAPLILVTILAIILGSAILVSKNLIVKQPKSISTNSEASNSAEIIKPSTSTKITQNTQQNNNGIQTPINPPSQISPYNGNDLPNCGNPTKKPESGFSPLLVALQGDGQNVIGYQWDFDGDGNWDTGVIYTNPAYHTYDKEGTYTPKYRVSGANKAWSGDCVYPYSVTVGTGAATLSAKTVCNKGHNNELQVHLDLILSGQSSSQIQDYWLSMTDESSGKTSLFYQGGGNFNNTYHFELKPIRQPGNPLTLIADGRLYTVYLWQHPYTDKSPNLEKIVAKTKFQTECYLENNELKQKD